MLILRLGGSTSKIFFHYVIFVKKLLDGFDK